MSAKNILRVMDFAEWLKTNRTKSKLSLRRLADRINNICSDAYLSQLENRRYLGKKGEPMRPDKEIVLALADVFRESPDVALNLAGYPTENTLPAFLTGIDFALFTTAEQREIRSFIEFIMLKRHQNIRENIVVAGDDVNDLFKNLNSGKIKKIA